MRDQAMNHFHGPEGHNCCQAILRTFQESGPMDTDIREAKAYGGGRAPENICGALYGVHLLKPNEAEKATALFKQTVGAWSCKEIRSQKLLPCRHCVGVAVDVLEAL